MTVFTNIRVVIIKANGNGFCGGHVASWGPDENPYPEFGATFEELYKGTADLFLWPTLYLCEFPKPTISQIHGYCVGGGIYLGLLTDFCVASEDAYFQMPLAQSLGEPGGHTMIERGGARFVPNPAAPALEAEVYPSPARIVAAVHRTFREPAVSTHS